VLRIRYEGLVNNTDFVFAKIAAFLKVSLPVTEDPFENLPEFMNYMKNKQHLQKALEAIDPSRAQRSKGELPAEVVIEIRNKCGQLAKILGYHEEF
jgi:predicted nuclease of restriction endonuclease-like (RecB) superfamily